MRMGELEIKEKTGGIVSILVSFFPFELLSKCVYHFLFV